MVKHVKVMLILKEEELNKHNHRQFAESTCLLVLGKLWLCVCALHWSVFTCCAGPRPNIPQQLLDSVGSTTQILTDGEMTLLRFVI